MGDEEKVNWRPATLFDFDTRYSVRVEARRDEDVVALVVLQGYETHRSTRLAIEISPREAIRLADDIRRAAT